MATRITVMLKGHPGAGDAGLLTGLVQGRCLVPAMTRRQFLRRLAPWGLP